MAASATQPDGSDGVADFALPCYLAKLSFSAVKSLQHTNPVVLLPIGAIEAHGPHLPLGTDVFLSDELARRAQQALWRRGQKSVIAPAIPYAVTEYGAAFAGTVSIEAITATALYLGVCSGLYRSGFSRLCLINSHLEPAHIEVLRRVVSELAQLGLRIAFADQTERRFARTLTEEYKRGNCHAGRYETALLLAAHPELVDETQRRSLPNNAADLLAAMNRGIGDFVTAGGPLAYFGDPASATAAEGDDIYAALVEMVLTVIDEAWPAG